MVISLTTSRVTPEQAQQVEQFLQGYLARLQQEAGVQAIYHYYRPEPGESTTLIIWDSDAARLAYRQSDLIKEAAAFEQKLGLASTREAFPLTFAPQISLERKLGDAMLPLIRVKTMVVNGVDLAYIEQGAGDAVVFVHGGNVDFRSWRAQMEPFAQRYRAIAYSRRYHYPNTGADQAPEYRATEHRDDLAALIEALGLAPVHIVSSSYGGFISLLLTRARPELVRSLVLGEPPVPMLLGPEAVQGMAKQVDPSRQAFARGEPEQAVRLVIDTVVGPGGFDRFPPQARQMMLDNAPEFKVEVNSAPDRYFATFRCEDARAIPTPTLLVTGEESPRFLHQMTDELERCLANSELAVIPHASHGMHMQNPQAYNQTVLAFLDRH